MDAPAGSGGARRGRLAAVLPIVTVVLVAATLASSVWWSDDAFPLAPFRMFAYGNRPDTVVRTTRLDGHLETGEEVRLRWEDIGLRRADLEGQTHPNRRVPDENLEALARVYNEHHDPDVVHLQVVVRRVKLVDGVPQPGETLTVIGDWATDDYDGPRVEVDMPLDEPTPGYRR